MKQHFLIMALCFLCTLSSLAQVDSIDVTTNRLRFNQLKEQTNTYMVYTQDSMDAPKRNMEIWERRMTKTRVNNKDVYKFNWGRFFSDGSNYHYEILADVGNFSPISEKILANRIQADSLVTHKIHYIYDGNSMYSNPEVNEHQSAPFKLDSLKNSFDWEMDMETFSMLPFEKGKSFAISFYHPGSKTLPNYYTYTVDRSEKIRFNEAEHKCWVLKITYPGFGYSEWWIDKKTFVTLKMREVYEGKLRYKVLVIEA